MKFSRFSCAIAAIALFSQFISESAAAATFSGTVGGAGLKLAGHCYGLFGELQWRDSNGNFSFSPAHCVEEAANLQLPLSVRLALVGAENDACFTENEIPLCDTVAAQFGEEFWGINDQLVVACPLPSDCTSYVAAKKVSLQPRRARCQPVLPRYQTISKGHQRNITAEAASKHKTLIQITRFENSRPAQRRALCFQQTERREAKRNRSALKRPHTDTQHHGFGVSSVSKARPELPWPFPGTIRRAIQQ
jgi:hypothetical protein